MLKHATLIEDFKLLLLGFLSVGGIIHRLIRVLFQMDVVASVSKSLLYDQEIVFELPNIGCKGIEPESHH